jgi:hypothetical protein
MIKCPNDDPSELERYKRLIRALMGTRFDFTPETETESSIQVERGTLFPALLVHAEETKSADLLGYIEDLQRRGTVVDRVGHSRTAYPGLLVYSWAQAVRLSERVVDDWRQSLGRWSDQLETRVTQFDWTTTAISASRGAEAAGAAWAALASQAVSLALREPRRARLAAEWFHKLAATQQSSGAFLRASASDNPETLWYHELVLLHAATSYAAQSDNPHVTAAVMRAAEYHLNETQPDHASSQPWGLLAFVWNPQARPLADQLLHSIQVQHPTTQDGVTSMLLADCLYCLERVRC